MTLLGLVETKIEDPLVVELEGCGVVMALIGVSPWLLRHIVGVLFLFGTQMPSVCHNGLLGIGGLCWKGTFSKIISTAVWVLSMDRAIEQGEEICMRH